MTDNFIQDYIKAGQGVIAAKKLAKKIIQPGKSYLEIAENIEAEIIKMECGLSFPINMSLNEIAAHYSPNFDDTSIIPERGLLKIDIGSHFNGYIADSAFTINLDEDPTLQNYVDAAKEAVDAAIELFNPGVRLYELGGIIAQKILNRGLRPITNLGGHELKQYNLHAGPFIPNYKDMKHSQVIKPGDAYACEPFATSGMGEVKNGDYSLIYRLRKKARKHVSYEERALIGKIKKNFSNLPFSPRWINTQKILPKDKINRTIKSFLGKNIIGEYPVLIEKKEAPVAQEEHTIVLDMDGNKIVTTKE
jgi:methionyl aminopeptidase